MINWFKYQFLVVIIKDELNSNCYWCHSNKLITISVILTNFQYAKISSYNCAQKETQTNAAAHAHSFVHFQFVRLRTFLALNHKQCTNSGVCVCAFVCAWIKKVTTIVANIFPCSWYLFFASNSYVTKKYKIKASIKCSREREKERKKSATQKQSQTSNNNLNRTGKMCALKSY